MNYFTNLFTVKTWNQFLKAGGSVTGFTEYQRPRASSLEIGDHLLCYLAGANRWVGVLEVVGPSYPFDGTGNRIWDDDYPTRVPVRVLMKVDPLHGPLVTSMLDRLETMETMSNKKAWGAKFLASLNRWSHADGELVEAALRTAVESPVETPIPPSAYNRRTPAQTVDTPAGGLVVIPDDDEEDDAPSVQEGTEHTRIQLILAQMGSAMGYDVFVPSNDRHRAYGGEEVGSVKRFVSDPGVAWGEAALRTIKNIDVLWLHQRAVVAAFEIESTTSVYSGLLRISDLTAATPNLEVACFVVAPDERQEKVERELLRPTFTYRQRPLRDYCQYIPFSALTGVAAETLNLLSHIGTQNGVSYVTSELAISFGADV